MTETLSINDLRGDPKNPRRISKEEYAMLEKTIDRFGDLSGIVLNKTTGELVGGHQRVKLFQSTNAQIEIAQRLEAPTKRGTIAIGFVLLDGERYAYREVVWDKPTQQAANIAANRIGGEFDIEILAEVTYEIMQADPELVIMTGQHQKEVDKLMESIGVKDAEAPASENQDNDDDKNELVFALTGEQSEYVAAVLEHIRINRDIPSADSKSMNGNALYYMAEEYVKHNPLPTPDEFNPPTLPSE